MNDTPTYIQVYISYTCIVLCAKKGLFYSGLMEFPIYEQVKFLTKIKVNSNSINTVQDELSGG